MSISRNGGSSVVPFENKDGVLYLTVKVNDVPMKFIFDTGAGIISMSTVEAEFLMKQGTLTEQDIQGVSSFCDASGDISECLIVLLKSVSIGDKEINNVQAAIAPNQRAPLLLGQSFLRQFGTITIDNENHNIIIK